MIGGSGGGGSDGEESGPGGWDCSPGSTAGMGSGSGAVVSGMEDGGSFV